MNSNSTNLIQSLWVGEALSTMEVMCINSYLHQGHEFHLYTYANIKNVPAGTILKDANEIIKEDEIFVDAFGGFVNLSNLFRYMLLYKKGGWWVDMDTVCLKPFNFDEAYVFSSEYSDPYQRFVVNTTFIKSQPGAQFLQDCINFTIERGHDHIHWGELGVNLISRMIFRNNMSKYIKPHDYFCPVSAHQLNLLIHKPGYQLPKQAFALHWWHEIWKRRELDKNAAFPEGTVYETMKEKYILT